MRLAVVRGSDSGILIPLTYISSEYLSGNLVIENYLTVEHFKEFNGKIDELETINFYNTPINILKINGEVVLPDCAEAIYEVDPFNQLLFTAEGQVNIMDILLYNNSVYNQIEKKPSESEMSTGDIKEDSYEVKESDNRDDGINNINDTGDTEEFDFSTLFGVLGYNDSNSDEMYILCNYETYLPLNIVKEVYGDKLDIALSQGYKFNNSLLTYTIQKLRTLIDDSKIINILLNKIVNDKTILKLLLNSIKSINDLDKFIKGGCILLYNPTNLSKLEATFKDNKVQFYCDDVVLDNYVIIYMIENGLRNYNATLDKLNSEYQRIYNYSDKLLCIEYILYNKSNIAIGVLAQNCYITPESSYYFIPMKTELIDIISNIKYTEPIPIDDNTIDYRKLFGKVDNILIEPIPAVLSDLEGIDELVSIIQTATNFKDVELLPELSTFKHILNKELNLYGEYN